MLKAKSKSAISDINAKLSSIKSTTPDQIMTKMYKVFNRLDLHEKTHLKIPNKSLEYSENSKKIYIHLVRISNLWSVYEGMFDLLEKYLKSDIFIKKLGKGKLVNGYLDTFSKKTAIYFSTTIKFNSYFENILIKSQIFPHKDGLNFIKDIQVYIKYLIEENVRVNQIDNNKYLNCVIDKLQITCDLKVNNYRKRSNLKALENESKALKWGEFLALIYSIRNHFYHNLQTGNESIQAKKSEKSKLIFLLLCYEMFAEVIFNWFSNEIDKYIETLMDNRKEFCCTKDQMTQN